MFFLLQLTLDLTNTFVMKTSLKRNIFATVIFQFFRYGIQSLGRTIWRLRVFGLGMLSTNQLVSERSFGALHLSSHHASDADMHGSVLCQDR